MIGPMADLLADDAAGFVEEAMAHEEWALVWAEEQNLKCWVRLAESRVLWLLAVVRLLEWTE